MLHNRDTSWKGEAFIAGWEISTGMWKHFQLGIMSLWAMGYNVWIYQKSVFLGIKKGMNEIGIIDLKLSKSELMNMEYSELVHITKKERITEMNALQFTKFLFWIIASQIIFLFRLIAFSIGSICIIR